MDGGTHQSNSINPLHNWTWEYITKYSCVKCRDSSLTSYCHKQSRLSLGIVTRFITIQNQSKIMRSKPTLVNIFCPPLLSWALHSLLQSCRETGNEGYGQFITCCLCHPYSYPYYPLFSVHLFREATP